MPRTRIFLRKANTNMEEGPSSKRRIQTDVLKLMSSNHQLKFTRESDMSEFCLRFTGPPGTAYDGGVWTIQVKLPDAYPYRPPYIRFRNRIYHPNIEEASGIVCLDVLNQTWTPLFDLSNVFDTFLPQLLAHPNASDPLNTEAAKYYQQQPEEFERIVKWLIHEYATEEVVKKIEPMEVEGGVSDAESVSSMSDED
jgi:ubiquitin-conjugating enzyme E2 H